jgi:DNA-binding CsgD family transcriptional regulator/PAS domain-containing protein
MREAEKLSAIIGHIYDAALEPALWDGVLEEAARFANAAAASLYTRDLASKTATVAHQYGLDPQYVQLYMQTYVERVPARDYFIAGIEEPLSTADVLPYRGFVETRFYKQWAMPQGLGDVLHTMLDKSATGGAAFVMFRHARDGLVDDETRRRVRLIVPHVRRAALVGKVIEQKTAQAANLADTLDGISAGMLLLDATGRIVHANAAGHAMLAKAEVLRAAAGRLVANDAQSDRILADIFASAGGGDMAIGVKGIALPLKAHGGERYVAHVLPLTSGARRRSSAGWRAAVALFVHKAGLDAPSPRDAIAKVYRLTPMELRVLLAVVEVGGGPEVAQALGIAETTVKTHLGHLYAKTGACRQADLVKLVAGFASPLVH